MYEPYFSFDTSEKYKDKILSIREEQKRMIKDGSACVCNTPWTVDGSRAKGLAMINENIRLALRAFNNECDFIIAKVDYKNIARSEE